MLARKRGWREAEISFYQPLCLTTRIIEAGKQLFDIWPKRVPEPRNRPLDQQFMRLRYLTQPGLDPTRQLFAGRFSGKLPGPVA